MPDPSIIATLFFSVVFLHRREMRQLRQPAHLKKLGLKEGGEVRLVLYDEGKQP